MKILSKSPLIFNINPDLLEGRKEVFYYRPEYINTMEKLKKSKYPLKTIEDISKMVKDGTHFTPSYTLDGVIFLMVKNIKEEKIDFNEDIKHISEEEHKKLKACQPKPNDVLLTKVGTIGIANVVPKNSLEFNIFVSVAKIELKEGLNPYYVKAFLNSTFGRVQMERLVKGVSQPDLHLIDIKKIKIPMPPLNIQNNIAEIMENAYEEKNEKIKKANKLIGVINDIIIKELEITFPRSIEQNVYWINSDILEDRRDPSFYSPKYLNFLKAIQSSPYEIESLKEISKSITSGQRPKGGVKYIKEGIPSVGGEHITSEGDFNFENTRYIPKQFHENQKKSWINCFDILIVKDGATTGKVAIVPDDFPFRECNINEHVFKIEVEDSYNPYYVFSYLFSNLGQKQINRLISGAAQKGITRDAIESVKIIVPPTETQNKIAEDVKRKKEEAKRLKREAGEVVEKTKKEFEKMIVGETWYK